jgi:hypothetical protein
MATLGEWFECQTKLVLQIMEEKKTEIRAYQVKFVRILRLISVAPQEVAFGVISENLFAIRYYFFMTYTDDQVSSFSARKERICWMAAAVSSRTG